MTQPEQPGGGDPGTPARRTPYELVFDSDEFESRVFPGIRDEAASRSVDPRRPERFGFLSTAADAVRSVVPGDAPPEALDQYRALLFQAFNFWRYGKRMYVLDVPVARYLVEAAPSMSDWELRLPHPSLYLQLPPNLFWGSISPSSTPEPVDGFFVTASEAHDPFGQPFQRLEVLVVLGIRRDRAGFSVIPFDTEAGPGIAALWAEAAGREGGADFENILPGGEISGLYSILTTTEVLKLVGRALWYIDTNPDGIREEAPGRAADGGPAGPPRPRLPYFRVTLGGGPGEAEE